jgi:penicillin-binding protein 1A
VRILVLALKLLVTIAVGAAALAGSIALLAPAGKTLEAAATPLGQLDFAINAPPSRSIVYDRFGNVMGSFSTQDRSPVKLKDIPLVLQNAVISIEDRKFYEHHGVDWGGTIRAFTKNVDAGGVTQGGSTITQQLVKNTLSIGQKRDLKVKVREAILAMRLEHEISKQQILEDYLNLIYFGNGAYGVQAAAERYFDTPLKKLNLAQAALLAGLIQSPEALNPVKHPDLAARRRTEVLDAMVKNGKATAAQAKAARAVPLPTKLTYPVSKPLDYYMDEVKNKLLNDPADPSDPSAALGSTPQARANAVYRGGLKIYTAYDPYVQYAAGTDLANNLPKNLGPITGALVAIDNSDGGVRAIANGRSFAQNNQYDPAVQGSRQAGSSFKVFTLAAALSHGYSPDDTIDTSPLNWRLGPGTGKDAFYNLSGDCNHGAGRQNLTSALGASDNCAFTRLELSLGPNNYGHDGVRTVIDTARAMGVDSAAKFDPSIVTTTLGTQGVNPLEMAQAYSTIANQGVLKRAKFIMKIVGPGNKVLYQANDPGHRVLDQNVALSETQMMFAPVRNGTASGVLGNFPRPIAGKTGTTDDHADAWFVGFTPQYTTAVWMGDPTQRTSMSKYGRTVWGGTDPARIWDAFMRHVHTNLPVIDFPQPNESLWPRASYITELGRKFTFRPSSPFGGGQQTQETTPNITTPPAATPTTVKKPGDNGKTPVTKPHKTPNTKPPSPPTSSGGP